MPYEDAEKVSAAISAAPLAVFATGRPAAPPRLALAWEERRKNFAESFHALWHEPRAPREFCGDPYFRDCWVSGRTPRGAFLAALGWHAVLVALLVPLWNIVVARPIVVRQHAVITWYTPVNDLPLILPSSPREKSPPPPERAKRPLPEPVPTPAADPGADAFHPRQTMLNAPRRPNHPRQTLIQPASTPAPPTILPELPNIVAWNNENAPALRIDPAELARLKPKARTTPLQQDVAAPEVANPQHDLEAIDIAAPEPAIKRPTLPVGSLAPRAKAGRNDAGDNEVAAPDVTAPDAGGTRLIALSATPAPVAPPAVPPGNLSSRLAISPAGASPDTPGANSNAAQSQAGAGPPGLSITGGNSTANISGTGQRTIVNSTKLPGLMNSAPAKNAAEPAAKAAGKAAESPRTALSERIRSGVAPEALLGPKRVYTLHVNMPNLTSASGSWILSFAELAPPEAQLNSYTNPTDLAAPEALRKVDPKYPPALRNEHVEGEVVLYAVIRADGTVDSIQLVSGIDPELDANAMQALAQWRFRPAERKGEAIDLEAIVHIPFRGAPTF